MTIGIILAVLYLLLVSRVLIKKTKSVQLKQKSLIIHKVLGIVLLVVAVVHLILAWQLIKQRPIGMYITGIIMILLAVMEGLSFLFRKKLKTKWIWIHRIAAVGILLCLIVHMILGFGSLGHYKEAVRQIHLDDIQIENIADGDYTGECDTGYVYARVQVSVENGEIKKVDLLEHRTEKGKPAEVISQRIVEQQQVAVDAVSGATNSSVVIEKAVCNALLKQ